MDAQQKNSKRKFAFVVFTTLILIGIFLMGCNSVSNSKTQEKTQAQLKISEETIKLLDDDASKGNEDSPVVIIEWGDYECSFCTRFFKNTLHQIEDKYINTGKVKLIYRDFPLDIHPNAQKAAEAAECAGKQEKYWEMHDMLFEEGVKGGVDSFKQFAVDLNLDTEKFNNCLDSGEFSTEVQKDMADGIAVGITGTPGFIINGKLVKGAQPFEVFEQIIDAELTK